MTTLYSHFLLIPLYCKLYLSNWYVLLHKSLWEFLHTWNIRIPICAVLFLFPVWLLLFSWESHCMGIPFPMDFQFSRTPLLADSSPNQSIARRDVQNGEAAAHPFCVTRTCRSPSLRNISITVSIGVWSITVVGACTQPHQHYFLDSRHSHDAMEHFSSMNTVNLWMNVWVRFHTKNTTYIINNLHQHCGLKLVNGMSEIDKVGRFSLPIKSTNKKCVACHAKIGWFCRPREHVLFSTIKSANFLDIGHYGDC